MGQIRCSYRRQDGCGGGIGGGISDRGWDSRQVMVFQKSDGIPEKWWGFRKVIGFQKSDGVPDEGEDSGMR